MDNVLTAVVTFVLTFMLCVYLSIASEHKSLEAGYMTIDHVPYRLVPLEK